MPHRNDMTFWPEIRCQRGHKHHAYTPVRVVLDGPTPYANYTAIPHDLAAEFDIDVWSKDYPVDGGLYCPAHDAVSETIRNLGVWEPRDTVLALHAFSHHGHEGMFVNFGSQLGWYTTLATLFDVPTLAIEADPDNADLTQRNWDRYNDVDSPLTLLRQRIDLDSEPLEIELPVVLAMMDIEGAELAGVKALRLAIDDGLVQRMIIEISPVFQDYYGEMVRHVMAMGFRAFKLPGSATPAVQMDGTTKGLEPLAQQGVVELVNSWHQENVYFLREDLDE